MAHRARSYPIEGSPHCPWLIAQQMPTQRLITRVLIAIAVGVDPQAAGQKLVHDRNEQGDNDGQDAGGPQPRREGGFADGRSGEAKDQTGDGNRDENPGDEALCRHLLGDEPRAMRRALNWIGTGSVRHCAGSKAARGTPSFAPQEEAHAHCACPAVSTWLAAPAARPTRKLKPLV